MCSLVLIILELASACFFTSHCSAANFTRRSSRSRTQSHVTGISRCFLLFVLFYVQWLFLPSGIILSLPRMLIVVHFSQWVGCLSPWFWHNLFSWFKRPVWPLLVCFLYIMYTVFSVFPLPNFVFHFTSRTWRTASCFSFCLSCVFSYADMPVAPFAKLPPHIGHGHCSDEHMYSCHSRCLFRFFLPVPIFFFRVPIRTCTKWSFW